MQLNSDQPHQTTLTGHITVYSTS